MARPYYSVRELRYEGYFISLQAYLLTAMYQSPEPRLEIGIK
jgi:hypothetical protein